jgi:oxygen-dependent protoporphyrinogen oxidase
VLFTTMIGGAQDAGAVDLADADLMRIVREDLKSTMGVTVAPFFSRIVRWPRGIPQYTLGHPDRLAAIDQALGRHPGLFVCGNSYRGISVNACVEEAPAIAEAVLAHAEARARV